MSTLLFLKYCVHVETNCRVFTAILAKVLQNSRLETSSPYRNAQTPRSLAFPILPFSRFHKYSYAFVAISLGITVKFKNILNTERYETQII
jgi:hypothetical protein